jgi:hypothetical protein
MKVLMQIDFIGSTNCDTFSVVPSVTNYNIKNVLHQKFLVLLQVFHNLLFPLFPRPLSQSRQTPQNKLIAPPVINILIILISFSFIQPLLFVDKYRVPCFNKSVFNWTFCQLLT